MPKKSQIASLFGKSPFKALQSHMSIVNECVMEVPALFDALIENNQEKIKSQQEKIFSIENDADNAMNDIRQNLPKGLFMAVDRHDLLSLLDHQDNIADVAQDIAGLLIERDMSVPAQMNDSLKTYVQRCVDTCTAASEVIHRIDELIETGFRGNEATDVENMIDNLSKIEDETDTMGLELVRLLFSIEDEMKPVSVMFWYQLIQWIGDLADQAEAVGKQMRLLIAK